MSDKAYVDIEYVGDKPRRFRHLDGVNPGDVRSVPKKDADRYIATGMFKAKKKTTSDDAVPKEV